MRPTTSGGYRGREGGRDDASSPAQRLADGHDAQLLRQEPVPGQPVPEQHTFELLAALVPCDLLGVDVSDLNGHSVGGIEVTCDGRRRLTLVPIEPDQCLGDDDHGGPHYLGYMHWNEHPREAEECGVVLER